MTWPKKDQRSQTKLDEVSFGRSEPTHFHVVRLCRLMCGKASPFRQRYFVEEAMPPLRRKKEA
jgi:hypothetical protein